MKTKQTLSLAFAAGIFSILLLPSPLVVAGPAVTGVAGGTYHTLFLKADGSLWAMGDNTYGQLGIGTSPAKTNLPRRVVASGVSSVASGAYHSLFRVGGSLWVMGLNNYGQLGDGTTTNHFVPENNHSTPESIEAAPIAAAACGNVHSLFLQSDALLGMGDDTSGELGVTDSGQLNTNSPTNMDSDVIAVAAGAFHSLYLTGSNGVSGETLYTLMSTNLLQPVAQWQPMATNPLNATGNFSITATNAVIPNAPQQFYLLESQ